MSLTFDEAVQPVRAFDEVITATGERVDTGALSWSADGATLVLPLRPGLPVGAYTAVWRVVSADTHVVSGSLTFGIGVDPTVVAAAPPDATGALDIAAAVAEGLVYVGLVLLLGVAAAAARWWPWALATGRARRIVRTGWLLTLVGTVTALLVQGPRTVDGTWSDVWRLAGAVQTFGQAFGWELVARAALLVAMVPLLGRSLLTGMCRRGLAAAWAAAGLALLVTVALTGHESVGTFVPLAMIAAVLHLAAMSVWLGGLVTLAAVVLPCVRAGGPLGAGLSSLRSWSITAYVCVACLVVTREYQASRQLAPVQALWSTAYGVVLMVKLVLITGMLAAAAVAQRRVAQDRVGAGDGYAALRRSVRIECALAVLVLAVTAVLVSQPPGNTTYGPPVALTAPLGPDAVLIRVDSTVRGRQGFELEVVDGRGRPVPVQSLTATLSSADIASLAVNVTPDAAATDGRWSRWRGAPVAVPDAGAWSVNLDVSIDDADAYATTARYQVW